MNTNSKLSVSSELRKIFWPIEWHENKKFIPMALMMFCILLNYSTLRSIKDGFVITSIGPEAVSFLKLYIVLPFAIIFMIIYTKLCNIFSEQQVFYTITSFFVLYIACFAFILYPYSDSIHPSSDAINELSNSFPKIKWFIKISGHWIFATFYVIAELWGSMILSLLFWQFANKITKTEEAKRFYSMFGLLGNFALPCTALILWYFLGADTKGGEEDVKVIVDESVGFTPVFIITIISGIVIMMLYYWINQNVLTDPRLYDSTNVKTKKSKTKLSVGDSIKMILHSKYLGLIVTLVIAYGISINIVEGVWKSKIKELYPTKEAYTMFMGTFQGWQGLASIIFMIIGSNILRRVSWKTAAIFTPIMILFTGCIFFGCVFFSDNPMIMLLTGALGVSPLAFAVLMGMLQNVLSKATKYSLFDSTKEMTYIPLDSEMKSKGKAAVDVIGARFGKSGGGFIQSTFFIIFHDLTFNDAIPTFSIIFFVIVVVWIYAVSALNEEYKNISSEDK